MYLFYLTEGGYSYFRVLGVYVGEVDPTPILDEIIQRETGGECQTYEAFDEFAIALDAGAKYRTEKSRPIRRKCFEALKAAGFKEVEECPEVWLGP